MQSLSGTSCGSGLGNFSMTDSSTVRQQLAALMQQLSGLQQQQPLAMLAHSPPSFMAAGSKSSSLAAADSTQTFSAGAAPLQRTTSTHAGAILRTLSTTNPRVLALAAAVAKTTAGSVEHVAVLSALKDEVIKAASSRTSQPTASGPGPADVSKYLMAHEPAAAAAAAAATRRQDTMPQQQQGLTQDALWAQLMAKAAARTGHGGSSHPSSPMKQPLKQQLSPTLPTHGSSDSALEGTSCNLPWALLQQAAAKAQEEEEEKDAALAAAAAAASAAPEVPAVSPDRDSTTPTAAAAAAAAAGTPMVVETAECSMESPVGSAGNTAGTKGTSSAKGGSQVVFKRRSTNNSNALQRHFNKPAPAGLVQRTQSEAAGFPKLQHAFKKQARKRPLVMRGNSSGNLADLHNHSQQQSGSQCNASGSPLLSTAAAAAGQPDYSAETGPAASAEAAVPHGSLMAHAAANSADGPTLSGVSLRAPAMTAPAAVGTAGGVSDVLDFLATREQQLQMLQEQLKLHRRRMMGQEQQPGHSTPAGLAAAFAGAVPMPAAMAAASPANPPASSSSATAAALVELQRALGLTPAPSSTPAYTAALLPPGGSRDVQMSDAFPAPTAAAAAAAAASGLLQANYGLLSLQHDQQQQQAAASGDGQVQALTALKALAAMLANSQQQQQAAALMPPPAPVTPTAAFSAGGVGSSSDLLSKLAAVLQPLV